MNGKSNRELAFGKNLVAISNLPNGAKVKMSRGTVRVLENGQFFIIENTCSTAKYDTLTIYKGSEMLEKKVFKIIDAGLPMLMINNLTCLDSIKTSDLSKHPVIKIVPDSLHYTVTHFEIVIIPIRGDLIGPLAADGERLNFMQLNHMNRLDKGAVLYLQNIKATCTPCNNAPFYEESIKINIKEGFYPWR